MKQSVCRLIAVFGFSLSVLAAPAQPLKTEPRPYRILTSGRQLTIKSNKNILNLMVWTNDGHRVVENKGINSNQVKVEIPVNRTSYYLMIEMPGGKVFTERIGVQ